MEAGTVITVWVLSFVGVILTVDELGVLFWTCFIVFALVCKYIEKHGKRMLRDLEDEEH
jgi:hypothetical protein